MNDKIRHLRQEYAHATLEENDLAANPFIQFQKWFEEAMSVDLPEPHAMTLSTVSADGRPSSRVVLLRNADEQGFVFFSNYQSRKSQEIQENAFVALNFFWQQIERQVRIEGKIVKLDVADSDAYFASRPRESQIGAWASAQSKVCLSRSELDAQVLFFTDKFAGVEVPRPPHWGGFSVKPDYFEFWQGRTSRLHDRMSYNLSQGNWQISRLNP